MRVTGRVYAFAAVLILGLTSGAAAQDAEIVLPLTINAVPAGETPAILSGEDIYVPISTLARGRAAGVSWDRVLNVARLRNAERPVAGEPGVSLRSLAPWTTFVFDEANLTLALTIDPALIPQSSVQLETARPSDIQYSDDTSTFLNYALSSSAFSNLNAFAEVGSSIRGHLLYTSLSSSPEGGFTRGLTNYTLDQRDRLRRVVFGDAVVLGDELSGSGIVAGATVARSYELDPYFVRFPSLSLRGTALTPSQVEVYVNGVLVDRRTVPPGPFEVANVPAASGTSAATVVVRDAFGREQTQSTSFYYSTAVLGRGLSEYNYSAGLVREAEGSFDYGDPMLFALHRYGVTNNLTVGGRIEATDSLVSGGPSVAFASRLGEFDLKVAGSSGDGHHGTAAQFGFRRLARRANFAGSIRLMSREYETFSLPVERDRPLQEATVFASYLPGWGNIGLQWTSSRLRDHGEQHRLALLTNIPLADRANLLFSAAAVEENGRRFGEYFAGVSIRAFAESTLNVAAHTRDDVTTFSAEMHQPLPVGSGWGYRVQSATAEGATISNASLQYQNDFGRYEVGIDPDDPDEASLSASGALVYQAGKLTATRPVSQSFALVRVPGVRGVRVYLSNQLVGRTDGHGDLLVPNLLPYYGNRIRIDDRDVPMTYDLQVVEQVIAPPTRGGALVLFPAREIHAATGSVVVRTASGDVIPAYGQIRLATTGEENISPIGGQGDFYFENVPAGSYEAIVEYEGGTCSFTLKMPATSQEIADLGRVVCEGTAP